MADALGTLLEVAYAGELACNGVENDGFVYPGKGELRSDLRPSTAVLFGRDLWRHAWPASAALRSPRTASFFGRDNG